MSLSETCFCFRLYDTLVQNVHRRLEILLFHKSLSLAPKIYSTLSIYLKKYFYVALVRTSSFHKWLSYWYLHNKSTKGSQISQLVISIILVGPLPCFETKLTIGTRQYRSGTIYLDPVECSLYPKE